MATVLTLAACGKLPAADGSPYVGAETCGGCHPQQFASMSASGHAASLHPAADHPLAASFPSKEWLVRATEYRLRFRRVGEQIRAEGFDDKSTMDIPVDWAFGAGDQAVTFVTRVNADSVPTEALAQFLAGGLFGLLIWWLNGRMRLTPEEVNALFRPLAIPALKAALSKA